MEEKMNFNFKKIFGIIPTSIYEELAKRKKFDNNWDAWLSEAISKALEAELVYDE